MMAEGIEKIVFENPNGWYWRGGTLEDVLSDGEPSLHKADLSDPVENVVLLTWESSTIPLCRKDGKNA